jgi:hypothetical protein
LQTGKQRLASPNLEISEFPKKMRAVSFPAPRRLFFVSMGAAFFVVAAMGFGPHLRAFVAGTFPISAVAHIHGALMTSWLLTFMLQGWLAATHRLDLHRRLGPVGLWLGVVVWISFIALTIRGYAKTKYPLDENIFYSLPQLYVIVVFAPLLIGAYLTVDEPQWHKRLLMIATITVLGAAVDRFGWLPPPGPGYWPQVMCLDLLLLPIAILDVVQFKRVHPATLSGGGFLIAAQSAVALMWPTMWWHDATLSIAHAILRAE